MRRLRSCTRAWVAETALALLAVLCLALGPHAEAAGQRDAALRPIVQHAIARAQCFLNRYNAAVWYTLMEPRLERFVHSPGERLDILKQVYCATHQPGAAKVPPGLVLAVMQVESDFNRWAVSASGAVGLMQVMPYWPERLGMKDYQLVHVAPNIRMGCAILRYYLRITHDDVRLALEEYNGSVGRHRYPDRVLTAWENWSGADDLGFPVHAAHGAAPPR